MAGDLVDKNNESGTSDTADSKAETTATSAVSLPASFTCSVIPQLIPLALDPLAVLPTGANGSIQLVRNTSTQWIYRGIKQRITTADDKQEE